MIELKDSLKYFLVLTVIIKHYKTILVVETSTVKRQTAANSCNSRLSFLGVKKDTLENVKLFFQLFGLFPWPFPFTCYFGMTYFEFNSSQDPSAASLYNFTGTFGAGLPRTESRIFIKRGCLESAESFR